MATSIAHRLSRTAIVALSGIALLVGCSSSDDAVEDAATDAVTETTSSTDGSQPDDTSQSRDGELPGSLVVTGAVNGSFDTAADDVTFRPGGGCSSGTFGVSMKVDQGEVTQFDVVVETDGVDSSTRGEIPVEFDTYAYDIASGNFEAEVYSGDGTLTIVDQQELQMSYELSGTLTSNDDESREITVDFDAVLPVSCN
jgi:hypothetical protein